MLFPSPQKNNYSFYVVLLARNLSPESPCPFYFDAIGKGRDAKILNRYTFAAKLQKGIVQPFSPSFLRSAPC
jgi:hypothetical protein